VFSQRHCLGHYGVLSAHTSGRMTSITDTRATGSNPSYVLTYTYLNGGDAFPHLTGVVNNISSGESYTLAYGSNLALTSPFTSTAFGTATVLQTVSMSGLNISHSLTYGLGTGELTQVTMPAGGTLAWTYRTIYVQLQSGGAGDRTADALYPGRDQ